MSASKSIRDTKVVQKISSANAFASAVTNKRPETPNQEKSRPPSSKGEKPKIFGSSKLLNDKPGGYIPLAVHKNIKANRESLFEKHSEEVLLLFRDLIREYDDIQGSYSYKDSEFPGDSNEILDISDQILKSKIEWVSVRKVAEEEIKFTFPDTKNSEFWLKSAVKGSLDDIHLLNSIMLLASNKPLFLKMCFRNEDSKGKYEQFEEQKLFAFRFYKVKHLFFTYMYIFKFLP